MSTVILTPTHIATDHFVQDQILPKQCRIDETYMKFFVSPNNDFIVAQTGMIVPELIDKPDSWEVLRKILVFLINDQNKKKYIKTLSDEFTKSYTDIFDTDISIIVTKTHRFSLEPYEDDVKMSIYSRILGDTFAIGANDYLAMGMLVGGMSLQDTYSAINTMSNITSKEFSSFNLSDLDDFKISDESSTEPQKV